MKSAAKLSFQTIPYKAGAIGAAIGAGVGAVIGLGLGAAIGGTIGGTIGGVVGKKMEQKAILKVEKQKFQGLDEPSKPQNSL